MTVSFSLFSKFWFIIELLETVNDLNKRQPWHLSGRPLSLLDIMPPFRLNALSCCLTDYTNSIPLSIAFQSSHHWGWGEYKSKHSVESIQVSFNASISCSSTDTPGKRYERPNTPSLLYSSFQGLFQIPLCKKDQIFQLVDRGWRGSQVF